MHIREEQGAMMHVCMQSKSFASAILKLNEHTKLKVTYRQEHGHDRTRGAEVGSLRYIEMLVDLVLQLITHLFGVTQQHLCVLFIKHWVVSTSIPSAHSALHHNHCLALPHLRQALSLSVRACNCMTLLVLNSDVLLNSDV